MVRYVVASLAGGLLFGVIDGLIHSNPMAQRLYAAYKPIAKSSINITAGIAIDLAYGFILAGVFLLLYKSLPGGGGLTKGVTFGLLLWFFRVVMGVAGEWMMFNLPAAALLYTLVTGLVEMLVLGLLYGLTLRANSGV